MIKTILLTLRDTRRNYSDKLQSGATSELETFASQGEMMNAAFNTEDDLKRQKYCYYFVQIRY